MKISVLAILLAAFGSHAQAANLTEMDLYQANSSGQSLGNYWDTLTNGNWNVYLWSGGIPLNWGNTTNVSPNFQILPGTTTIDFAAEYAWLGGYAVIQLFFDGSASPSISAMLSGTPGGTLSLLSGTTSFIATSGETITLTSASVGYSGRDLVGPWDNSPCCSSNDVAGTLNLDATPEPGSLGLLLCGAGAIGLLIRRR